MYICICNAVNDKTINEAIERGAASADEVFEMLGVAAKCGTCKSGIEGMIKAASDERSGVRTLDPALSSPREYSLAAE